MQSAANRGWSCAASQSATGRAQQAQPLYKCAESHATCIQLIAPCLHASPARSTIFNGNGKLPAELALAVDNGVLINVDSEFDLANIQVGGKFWG